MVSEELVFRHTITKTKYAALDSRFFRVALLISELS